MDAQVPAVVAVVVTTGEGPWFEETLASLASQTYEELSVLVLGTDEAADPTVPDDVVSRLKAFIEARGDDAYLGCLELNRDSLSKPCDAMLKNYGK